MLKPAPLWRVVLCRLRPPLRRTWETEPRPIVELDAASANVVVVTHDAVNREKSATYHYDVVLDAHTTQEELYDR